MNIAVMYSYTEGSSNEAKTNTLTLPINEQTAGYIFDDSTLAPMKKMISSKIENIVKEICNLQLVVFNDIISIEKS